MDRLTAERHAIRGQEIVTQQRDLIAKMGEVPQALALLKLKDGPLANRDHGHEIISIHVEQVLRKRLAAALAGQRQLQLGQRGSRNDRAHANVSLRPLDRFAKPRCVGPAARWCFSDVEQARAVRAAALSEQPIELQRQGRRLDAGETQALRLDKVSGYYSRLTAANPCRA
jgi:hypothetical protein